MKRVFCILLAAQTATAHGQELALHQSLQHLWSNPSASLPARAPIITASSLAQDRFVEMDRETLDTISKGLAALAKIQNADGSFGNGSAPLATTAMAGLAFLAGGHLPQRSAYGRNVERVAEYILKRSGRTGYINEANGGDRGTGDSKLYGHGYSLLFLTQLYGMNERPGSDESERIREAITRAVKVIESAQDKSGGWNYDPVPGGDEGSVTVTQVQALRAAREIGVAVNIQTVHKAIEYINKVTSPEGRTRYSLSNAPGNESAALTGAGICVLAYLGEYKSPKITKGLDFLLAEYTPGGMNNNPKKGDWNGWYFYGSYYSTLAMYHGNDAHWRRWWPLMKKSLTGSQDADGLWKVAESQKYGDAFGTSLALLMLQVPLRYLPIFQRSKD